MLLELCEFCHAGAAHLSGADLQCRRCEQSCHGAEGSEKPGVPRVGNTSGQGWRRHGRDVLSGTTRPERRSKAASVPKVRCTVTRGRCERVKRAPYKAETRNAACKGVSAVRRHAGGLYDAGSYSYTLVKCLKPFVRNGKGVIEANDYAQGPPINSEPLVMKQIPRNEKRAPKAYAGFSVFDLLSVLLLHFLFCFLVSFLRLVW
jgi:hypothetical protein